MGISEPSSDGNAAKQDIRKVLRVAEINNPGLIIERAGLRVMRRKTKQTKLHEEMIARIVMKRRVMTD